jgi:EmrB/QacA subfamily drug resistance transporter
MNRWRVLAISSVGVFVAGLDLFIVNIAFPDIERDFPDSSLAGISWVLSAYAIVLAALLVPAGRYADRIGRKRSFIVGMGVFTAASALCAVAPSVGALVAARVLQAVGAAMLMPASLGLILPAFEPAQRPVAVGIWSAAGGVAAALGPPLGGVLVELSWRWIFLVNVPIGIVTIVLASRMLGEIRERESAGRPVALGALMLAAGVGLLTLGIVQGHDWGWASARVVGSFAAAIALMFAFVIRSARHPLPVIELPMLQIRSVAVANSAALVFFAGFAAMLLSSVLLLTQVWGYSTLHAGIAIAPGPLTAALVAVPTGRIVAKIGPRLPGVLGGLFFAAGFAVNLASVSATPDYAGSFLPGFVLGGIGVGLSLASQPAAATSELPPDRFATGTAIFGMARQLGSALGVAVLVAIVSDSAGADLLDALDAVWAFALGTGIVTALAMVFLRGAPSRVQAPAPVIKPRLAD